ncbi:MAG: response regulator [Thermodesulfovibrionia bacterium]|nr:response regulator [Thermodesulfovibrionia bacterium]
MKKILIVDDNEKNRKLLKVIIESHGYETVEADNGKEGVRLARESKPLLILMDIQMPVMDGIEAAKILKSEAETAGIPVIAVTSYAMKGDREKFLATGINDYIAKPIDVNEVISIIDKYSHGE